MSKLLIGMAFAGLTLAAFPAKAQAQSPGLVEASRIDRPKPPNSLDGAPIALMVDLGSGRTLFEREANRRFLPASLTKLMTVYTAFELLDAGAIDHRQMMPVRPETARSWSGRGSTMFVARADAVSVDVLLQAILTVSANDGCIVLAEGAAGSVENYLGLMNANARKLGMTDSHFGTPNGWPDEGRTYTTAGDLVRLATALVNEHPEKYRRYFGLRRFDWEGTEQRNRNPVLDAVAGADGLKTGFTNEAGFGFVGSAERNGRRIVMVIAGTESGRERKTIARDFLEWGFAAWDNHRLYGAGQPVTRVRVQGGANTNVPVVARRPVFVTTPDGKSAQAKVRVRYRGPLLAPVRKGDDVGYLQIVTSDGTTSRVKLFAERDVEEADPLQRLRNGIVGLFR